MFTSQFTKDTECSICLMPFCAGEETAHLPCWDTHIFHKKCLEKYMETSPEDMTCLICRKPFKKEDVTYKVLQDKVPEADPFDLGKDKETGNNVDAEKKAAMDAYNAQNPNAQKVVDDEQNIQGLPPPVDNQGGIELIQPQNPPVVDIVPPVQPVG